MVENTLDMECMNLFELMKAEEAGIPYSMRLLIRTIHKLTIGTVRAEGNGSGEVDGKVSSTCSGDCNDDKEEAYRDQRNVFYASSCAVLFLRLICPSVINPLEWGALRMERGAVESPRRTGLGGCNGDDGDDEDGLDVSESVRRVDAMNRNPAAASLILVAHVLHHDRLAALWRGDEASRRALQQLVNEVVMVVPIDKVRGGYFLVMLHGGHVVSYGVVCSSWGWWTKTSPPLVAS